VNKLERPQIKLIRHYTLEDHRSVSGLEVLGKNVITISDNEHGTGIAYLDSAFRSLVNKGSEQSKERQSRSVIPKDAKPDYEALTLMKGKNKIWLIKFGSGSRSPQRDFIYLEDLTSLENDTIVFNAGLFYQNLRDITGISTDAFNLEGACTSKDELFLFNRGTNGVIRIPISEFLGMVDGDELPKNIIYQTMTLPPLQGNYTGVSGATYLPERDLIIFTASVERTTNWIDDGDILGSGVGWFPANERSSSFEPDFEWIAENGIILKYKVEAVGVDYSENLDSKSTFKLILASDNDSEECEMLEMEMIFSNSIP